ncbi:hypothetical protein OH492_15340 [Vibrio chagasii]|nr:hypothetical protein [Vibrio chagasii]
MTRQVAALASQLGDGISNWHYPTNGGLLAVSRDCVKKSLAVSGCCFFIAILFCSGRWAL